MGESHEFVLYGGVSPGVVEVENTDVAMIDGLESGFTEVSGYCFEVWIFTAPA